MADAVAPIVAPTAQALSEQSLSISSTRTCHPCASRLRTCRSRLCASETRQRLRRRKTLLLTIIAMRRAIARTHAKGQLRFDFGL